MPKYVAFLRAINVGAHTVKMDHLRRLFEDLEFSNVETFIASGNVVFNSPSKNTKVLETRISDYLHESLGYGVATFIRSTYELSEVARYKPFRNDELNAEGNVLWVFFLPTRPNEESIQKVLSLRTLVDDFHIHERELYWLRRSRIGESRVSGTQLEKTLRMKATARNSTTVKKIAARYPADERGNAKIR